MYSVGRLEYLYCMCACSPVFFNLKHKLLLTPRVPGFPYMVVIKVEKMELLTKSPFYLYLKYKKKLLIPRVPGPPYMVVIKVEKRE